MRAPVIKPELQEILKRYQIDPYDTSKVWDVHGTLVLYHRAYEIIAAKEGIVFDPPVMIEAKSADRIVAMLVVGHMKDRTEWSVGEASPGNSKNAYPYAIAEKRAKDRVVSKLVGLAAYVYSEDEADSFSESKAEVSDGKEVMPPEPRRPSLSVHNAQPPSHVTAGAQTRAADVLARADAFKDRIEVVINTSRDPMSITTAWAASAKGLRSLKEIDPAAYAAIEKDAKAAVERLGGTW